MFEPNRYPSLKYSFIFLVLLLQGIFFIQKPLAFAADLTLGWDPCFETDVVGYRVHYGTISRIYDTQIDVGNSTEWTLSGLEEDTTYFFAVTAYNSAGKESTYSQEFSVHTGLPLVPGGIISSLKYSSRRTCTSYSPNIPGSCSMIRCT